MIAFSVIKHSISFYNGRAIGRSLDLAKSHSRS